MEEGITAQTNYAVLMRKRGSQKVDVVLAYITKKTATAMAHRLNSGERKGDWVYWATDDWDEETHAKNLPWPGSLDVLSLSAGTMKLGKVSDSVRVW